MHVKQSKETADRYGSVFRKMVFMWYILRDSNGKQFTGEECSRAGRGYSRIVIHFGSLWHIFEGTIRALNSVIRPRLDRLFLSQRASLVFTTHICFDDIRAVRDKVLLVGHVLPLLDPGEVLAGVEALFRAGRREEVLHRHRLAQVEGHQL